MNPIKYELSFKFIWDYSNNSKSIKINNNMTYLFTKYVYMKELILYNQVNSQNENKKLRINLKRADVPLA